MNGFFRYIRLHDAGPFESGKHGLFCTVFASGFILRKLGATHGQWSALGEFICCKGAAFPRLSALQVLSAVHTGSALTITEEAC